MCFLFIGALAEWSEVSKAVKPDWLFARFIIRVKRPVNVSMDAIQHSPFQCYFFRLFVSKGVGTSKSSITWDRRQESLKEGVYASAPVFYCYECYRYACVGFKSPLAYAATGTMSGSFTIPVLRYSSFHCRNECSRPIILDRRSNVGQHYRGWVHGVNGRSSSHPLWGAL